MSRIVTTWRDPGVGRPRPLYMWCRRCGVSKVSLGIPGDRTGSPRSPRHERHVNHGWGRLAQVEFGRSTFTCGRCDFAVGPFTEPKDHRLMGG